MSFTVCAYDNGDHVGLIWLPSDDKPIAGCRGFAVRRICNGQASTYLPNYVSFDENEKGTTNGSDQWPIQRYMWWDYDVKIGDKVVYQILPVMGQASALKVDEANASAKTDELTITGQCTKHISAFFNRGIVAAQWVARGIAKEKSSKDAQGGAQAELHDIIDTPGDALRDELGGLLKQRVLEELDATTSGKGSIYAALYELNDPELTGRLTKLGPGTNLVLGNGAFKSPDNDENAAVRAQLKKTSIHLFDRIVSSGHFAHNKFVVFCDSAGKVRKVLTGSLNWTVTGVCTQANNGMIIEDDVLADAFLQQWHRLKDAGNAFPKPLVQANSTPKSFTVDGGKASVWFTPTDKAEDLDQARKLINDAKQGILFLFFNPGTFQEDPTHWTLLQSIINRHTPQNNPAYDGQLYLRGVVNQTIAGLTDVKPGENATASHMDPASSTTPVALYEHGNTQPIRFPIDVLVPFAIKQNFAGWVPELLKESVAMVHSKCVVIDPFGDHPVVMTGSHNLGLKASQKNDDNLVIIENNPELAVSYALNIIAIYQNYRWRRFVQNEGANPSVFRHLADDDKWQAGHLQGDALDELEFWLGGGASVPRVNSVAATPAGAAPRVSVRVKRTARHAVPRGNL